MEIFLASILILATGAPLMLGYAFVLYKLGRLIAQHWGRRFSPVVGAIAIAIGWLPVSLLALAFPVGQIMQVGIAISLYFLHGQPTCVGFWAGCAMDSMESERRWAKNADDWLADWECREVPDQQGRAD